MDLKKKQETVATISYFPEEILQEIFLRMPTKSLLRFRCVNKFFCALFDSHNFQNMHHELSNIINGARIMFYYKGNSKIMHEIDYKSISSLLPLSISSVKTCEFINRMDYTSIFQDFNDVEVLSSCNALVLIRATKSGSHELYIWNPTRNEYKNMSRPQEVNNAGIIYGYGFCYDYKTNDYKVVRIVVDWEAECSNIDVYTLSSNSWKSTPGMPSRLYYKEDSGVLFNGTRYWLAYTFVEPSTVLIYFDIVNEIFEEVAMPEAPIPYPEEPLERDMFQINVEVLGGCLCLVFHIYNVRVDVWIMQDYGVRESWTKTFSINQESIISSTYLDLIWSFKNNETLWMLDHDFVLYDPNKKLYKKLMLDSHITITGLLYLTNEGAGIYSA